MERVDFMQRKLLARSIGAAMEMQLPIASALANAKYLADVPCRTFKMTLVSYANGTAVTSVLPANIPGNRFLSALLAWLGAFSLQLILAQNAWAFDVTTYHYDTARTGWNSKETELTPSRIRSAGFGLIRSVTLDEQVDAQPLVVTDIKINNEMHEVIYVATEKNTLYEIDAPTGEILNQKSLGPPVPAGIVDCGNNAKVIGVTSTPVIDRESGILYIVSFNDEDGRPVYRVHALDLATLEEKTQPQIVAASASLSDGSNYNFDARFSRQRPALAFFNGKLYAAFGSFCDHDADKTRGWILGWKASTLEPLAKGSLTDRRAYTVGDFFLASVWMSGFGPAVDESGNLYFVTGNSDKHEASPPVDPTLSVQESAVKVDSELLEILDYFTPSDVAKLDKKDDDFGSGGMLLIPGEQSGPIKHLAVAAGKIGRMFLLDRDNLGKFDKTKNNVLAAVNIGRCWCGQSYFVGPENLGHILSSGDNTLSSWRVQPMLPDHLIKEWDAIDKLGSDVFQKGFFTSISSNGMEKESAIVWAVQRPSKAPPALALWAFDAKDGATLVKSLPAGPWPNTGGAANTVPVVANGRVYVASYKELRIFGLGVRPPEEHQLVEVAPLPPSRLYGTVVEVEDDSTLWLRTASQMVRVDIVQATARRKVVNLSPGNAVMVNTTGVVNGTAEAETIEYAPDNPALWPSER